MQTAEQMLRWKADGWRKLAEGRDCPFIFEEWLLKNGEPFGPIIKRPKGLHLKKIKQCYQNTFQAVLYNEVDPTEWFYTEGVVHRDGLPIEISHAWLSNRKGEVIDLTLRDAGPKETYYGIPFKLDYVVEQTMKNGYYGLFSDGCTYNQDVIKTVNKGRAWRKNAKKK